MEILGRIGRIPLFQGLPKEHIKALAGIVKEQRFERGEIIFSEGEEGTGLFVVDRGRVKVYKLSPEGKEQTLHIFGPGEPFGEVPVFAGERFPAHAEALEKSRVFFFPRDEFAGLIQQDPSLALNMLAVLARRLRRFTAMVEDLSLKEVPGRLAGYLLSLNEDRGLEGRVDLQIRKGQLASLLGTSPETLSRILARMTQAGLISLDGPRSIRILDVEGLEELASGERRLT
jgi:CRP/FNR family transcriptional regulator